MRRLPTRLLAVAKAGMGVIKLAVDDGYKSEQGYFHHNPFQGQFRSLIAGQRYEECSDKSDFKSRSEQTTPVWIVLLREADGHVVVSAGTHSQVGAAAREAGIRVPGSRSSLTHGTGECPDIEFIDWYACTIERDCRVEPTYCLDFSSYTCA
jgi:hypothetical protein